MTDNSDKPRMSVKEFREQGYLQELNRRFLHPLGMALEVVLHEDGSESFGEVWDYRDDPEGMVFGAGIIDENKAYRIYGEENDKREAREKLFGKGFNIQPLSLSTDND